MKIIFYLLISFLFGSLYFASASYHPVLATCDNVSSLTVNPPNGSTNTSFSITGSIVNCIGQSNLVLDILDSSGSPVNAIPFTTDASGNFSIGSVAILQAGTFSLRFRFTGDLVPSPSTSITIVSAGAVRCGDLVQAGYQGCPLNCPALWIKEEGPNVWRCAGTGKGAGQSRSDPEPCFSGDKGVETAIGCVPTEPRALAIGFVRYFSGIVGVIAMFFMIKGAFMMLTSGGNPESLKSGQEQFTSALIGLLFVLFSVTLLQIIGVDILDIPGFER